MPELIITTFDSKTDRLIQRAGDAGVNFDIVLMQRINKETGRKFNNPQILKRRYEILKRRDFTGKLIQDKKQKEQPKPGDNNVVMIPAKIYHKKPEPQPDAFADTDRIFVHMHNLFAELVAVAKEIAATEKRRLDVETSRMNLQKESLAVQREQLTIQNALFIKATEKK